MTKLCQVCLGELTVERRFKQKTDGIVDLQVCISCLLKIFTEILEEDDRIRGFIKEIHGIDLENSAEAVTDIER